MGKLPTTKRFNEGDQAFKDERSWIGRLFGPLNEFIVSVISLCNNNITFSENIAAQVITIKVRMQATATTGPTTLPDYVEFEEPVEVSPDRLKSRPIGLWLVNAQEISSNPDPLKYGVVPIWEYTSEELIRITGATGLEEAKRYQLTLIAISG